MTSPASSTDLPPAAIVVFDGDCGFCTRAVRFIARRDPSRRFRFLPALSDRGQRLLAEHGFPPGHPGSMVLIEPDGRCFTRSTASLRIARGLTWPARLWSAFIVVPRPIRDFFYNLAARNRHRWFAAPACETPDAVLRERMLS